MSEPLVGREAWRWQVEKAHNRERGTISILTSDAEAILAEMDGEVLQLKAENERLRAEFDDAVALLRAQIQQLEADRDAAIALYTEARKTMDRHLSEHQDFSIWLGTEMEKVRWWEADRYTSGYLEALSEVQDKYLAEPSPAPTKPVEGK